MKVRVSYRSADMSVDEVFTGASPEAVVSGMQRAVAGKVNFALRILVNSLSPLSFAQEVVKRYSEATGKSIPSPKSCAEFLEMGVKEGLATVIEP